MPLLRRPGGVSILVLRGGHPRVGGLARALRELRRRAEDQALPEPLKVPHPPRTRPAPAPHRRRIRAAGNPPESGLPASGSRASAALSELKRFCYVPIMPGVRLTRALARPAPIRRACPGSAGLIGESDQKRLADRRDFYLSANFGTSAASGAPCGSNLRSARLCAKGAPFQASAGKLRERRPGASLGPLNLKPGRKHRFRTNLQSETHG